MLHFDKTMNDDLLLGVNIHLINELFIFVIILTIWL